MDLNDLFSWHVSLERNNLNNSVKYIIITVYSYTNLFPKGSITYVITVFQKQKV